MPRTFTPITQPYMIPQFVDFSALAQNIRSAGQIGRLVNRTSGALIGDWRVTASGLLLPIDGVDLSAVSTSLYGVVSAADPGEESVTLTAGHTTRSGLATILDSSTGVFTQKTITVVADTVSWSGAIAGIAAGDGVYMLNVSEIEIDGAATGLAPSAAANLVKWSSGLSMVSTVVNRVRALCFGLGAVSLSASPTDTTQVRAEVTIATAPDAVGDYVGVGWQSIADSTKYLTGGVAHNGTSAREAGSVNGGAISYAAAITTFDSTMVGASERFQNAATPTTLCTALTRVINTGGSINLIHTNGNHLADCVVFELRGSQSAVFTKITRA